MKHNIFAICSISGSFLKTNKSVFYAILFAACVLCRSTDLVARSGLCTGPSECGRSSHGLQARMTARVRERGLTPGGRRSSGEVSSSLSRRASSAAPPSCRRCLPARDLSSEAPPGPLSGCRNRGYACKTLLAIKEARQRFKLDA